MKTTKIYLVVCLMFFLTQFNAFAQYNGGNSNGATINNLSLTSCSIPSHFYAYFGGVNDGSGVDELSTTACGTAAFQYAYLGGVADGAATEEISVTACGIPPSFFAYMGGNNDGAGVETLEANVCPFPPSFYAYFGGNGDGFTLDRTAPICPTQPPVTNFTASATSVCVGQSVTFTDTSTNIPSAWTWTLPGGTPNSSTDQNPTVVYNTAGTYTVTLQAANFNGLDTKTVTNMITVTAYPTVTSVTPASRCDAGTITLGATASAGTLSWYATATGGSALGTGTSFTTPSISATTTYYVETVNASCSSSRTAVIATVNTTPTITATTPASRCDAGSVTLNATSSAGSTIWYASATGGLALATTNNFVTPSISSTTTYYVEASTGSCTSPRTAVIATVNTTPIVTSTTPATRCDSGTVTLGALANSGTLNWYAAASGGTSLGTGTSFTTPSLTGTTTYYVAASNATCASVRTAVTATVNATPTITGTAASRCDAGTVTLVASATAGTISWYANASGGSALGTGTSFITPSISTTTTYYAESVNGTCTSSRIPVIATVNTSPTITSTTPVIICSGDTFTISATASAGTLAWYNVATGGLVQGTGSTYSLSNLTATTTFYVQATNGSCQSARTPVIVTVNQRPSNTGATGASRCGSGTLTLSASYTNGTINWYDAASGGNLVFTGSNFVTPSLSVTTTYYVEGVNGTCVSFVRTPITAIVNAIPVVTSTTPASRCGTGSVALNAVSSVGTLVWFGVNTGGTALGTGTTFNTPSIASTTTYYVEATNGTCTSTRTAVIATIDIAQTITSTTPAGRCDTGSVTLSAAATGGTLNWYANASGGSILATGSNFITPSISSSTTYYVEVTNGTCTSARIAVTASVNGLGAPTGNANQSFCSGGTVGSLATSSGTNIVWYSAATGGTVIPNSTALVSGTTYYASQNNGTCESATRLAVTVTLNAIPTVTSTTPASRCGAGSLTLNAASSIGTLVWYGVATGGTALATGTSFSPTISGTTTYYVEAVNGTCTSARTAVIATIDIAQTITSTTPAGRCDTGSVTLSAAATGGTLNWYANASGGSILATGSNFTTPSISSSTTYYVEVTNGTCTSARIAVTASINLVSAPIGNVNQSFCAGETVGLLVITSGTSIVWYTAATGGAVVPNSTPLVSGTTYYASQNNGTCESPTRLAVTATLGNCLGTEEFVINQIKAYPNPVTDMLTISSTEMMSSIMVVDMLGRVLSTVTINDAETKIDMTRYPTGTYLVHVSADSAVKTFKVIKK